MKASVVTLALFSAAAIANPVAVEKREVEPRALPSVPALAGITGATGLGNLGNIPVVTGLVNAGDVLVTLTTLLQTILNTLQTFRSGIPGNALAPITGITGVSGDCPGHQPSVPTWQPHCPCRQPAHRRPSGRRSQRRNAHHFPERCPGPPGHPRTLPQRWRCSVQPWW
ncbi:hypothetical protein CKAH01_00641 [Colletotrichum kahawae]|uniref:Uncharacterized protein n=1 Tax=Colletotrichum kahawae TaxID=34407 RepID=A0AAD9YK99_COLKA|nr:hypothetical protein CKAH01_00641 [Colletotrichum kahawae]